MTTAESRPGAARAPLDIRCEPLAAFDASDLAAVRHAFRSAAPCAFQQAWLEQPHPRFAPAVVRTGLGDRALLVFAELTDADIFNRATTMNQRTWELGDVLEMFLSAGDDAGYVELQVTPENQRLQLRYPDRDAVEMARKTGKLEAHLIWTDAFRSRTWIEQGAWYVYAEIPALTVTDSSESIARWRFSFSRYDHTRGVDEPVISSTSPHAKPDFHRREEWGVLRFDNLVGSARQ